MHKYNIFDAFSNGLNTFFNKDPTNFDFFSSNSSYERSDRLQLSYTSARTMITPIYNRIAVDCSQKIFKHVIVDENERFLKDVESGLNNCLGISANIDQSGRQFIKNIVLSLLDEGYVCVVPTIFNCDGTWWLNDGLSAFDITEIRVGKITQWFNTYIQTEVYNHIKGTKEKIYVPKKCCAIIENPFYQVMNEHNSIAQRLMRNIAILDAINEEQGNKKLNILMKLPYSVRTDLREQLAKKRRDDLEKQLLDSTLGIAYIDNQEEVQQLNKPISNQLVEIVTDMKNELYSQLSMPKEIISGNPSEMQINVYLNSTIKPILNAIKDEFNRKFLSKTARTQGHTFKYYINPFDFVSLSNVADLGDKLTRNAIMTSNEFRGILGLNPSDQMIADELSNKNMPVQDQSI